MVTLRVDVVGGVIVTSFAHLGVSQGLGVVVPQAGAIAQLPALSAGLETLAGLGGGQAVIPSGGAGSVVPALPVGGIGEGLVPVPEKTANKILNLEFVEMN